MAANALGADGINGPMCAKIIGGMTPPIGLFIATLLKKDKFTKTEIETAKTALPMGLCFITEGVLPFAAADPLHFIPASMIGSAVACAIAVGSGCESSSSTWRYLRCSYDEESGYVPGCPGNWFYRNWRSLCNHQKAAGRADGGRR